MLLYGHQYGTIHTIDNEPRDKSQADMISETHFLTAEEDVPEPERFIQQPALKIFFITGDMAITTQRYDLTVFLIFFFFSFSLTRFSALAISSR
jgi:hypothetical protein